ATPLTVDTVATGLSSPVFVTGAGDGSGRLFIVEQTGAIKILKGGSVLPTPFLDLSGIVNCCGEEGLLGLAFHPQFATNGFFYVNYVTGGTMNRHTVVARYQVSPMNPDSADENSAFILLNQTQPFANHNAGMLAFGPNDSLLYVGFGDGGSAGDPNNNAQNPLTFLGKMLRIDVDNPDVGKNYGIPAGNPFVGTPDTLDEIWALGLRNPWRWSFDRATGELYIADVGQNMIEEIDYQPAVGGGENYGWRCREGSSDFNFTGNCATATLIDPIHEYIHELGRCSITGGYVYHGCAMPDMNGTYFFADFCSGEVWSFTFDGTTVSNFTDRTAELGLGPVSISSFGEDDDGELYIVDLNGGIFKIVPDGVASQCNAGGCCIGNTGNVNNDPNDIADVADLTTLIDHLFISFTPLACPEEANVNGDPGGTVDVADLTTLIDHLFISFTPTAPCQVAGPTVSFATDIQPILQSRCAVSFCHGSGFTSGGMTMGGATYNEIISASGFHGPIVVGGDASQSNLYLKTTSTPPFGARMPFGGPFLTTEQQNLIRDWINEGAQDN
ncbi:MAG: hypothetical protein D6800_12600, partial [Candidatus Zixiibacteriota bacterium]